MERMGTDNASTHLDVVTQLNVAPVDTLQITQNRLDHAANKTRECRPHFTETYSMTGSGLEKCNDRSSDFLYRVSTNETSNAQTMTDFSMDTAKTSHLSIRNDMMKESLDKMYQKMEEMENTIQIQNRKTDKRFKEMDATIKTQLRGTRRRIEGLERKSN